MRVLLVAIAVTLCCANPVLANGSWPTHLAIGTFMTAQGTDLSTSMYLLGSNQGREANPLLAPFADKPVVFGALKMGLGSTASYLILRIHKTHPKLAFALAAVGASIYIGATVHNARLLRR